MTIFASAERSEERGKMYVSEEEQMYHQITISCYKQSDYDLRKIKLPAINAQSSMWGCSETKVYKKKFSIDLSNRFQPLLSCLKMRKLRLSITGIIARSFG